MLGQRSLGVTLWILSFTAVVTSAADEQDPLPSWDEGAVKDAIIDFVHCAAHDGCPKYIPTADRVAVFDNDGTLWSEQPA